MEITTEIHGDLREDPPSSAPSTARPRLYQSPPPHLMTTEESLVPDSQSTTISFNTESSEPTTTTTRDNPDTLTSALTTDQVSSLSIAKTPQNVYITGVDAMPSATNTTSDDNSVQNDLSSSSDIAPRVSFRQQWLMASKSASGAAEVARQTRDNTMNNHLVTAPTELERLEHASVTTNSEGSSRRLSKRSHRESSTASFSSGSSSSSSDMEIMVEGSTCLVDAYYGDDETGISHDDDRIGSDSGDDGATSGPSLPFSPQLLSRAGGKKRRRLVMETSETEQNPQSPRSAMPMTMTTPTTTTTVDSSLPLGHIGILRSPVRHQPVTPKKTVRFKIPETEMEDEDLIDIDEDSDKREIIRPPSHRSMAERMATGLAERSHVMMTGTQETDTSAKESPSLSSPSSPPRTWSAFTGTARSSIRPNPFDTTPALSPPFSPPFLVSRPLSASSSISSNSLNKNNNGKDNSDSTEGLVADQQQEHQEMSSPNSSKSALWSPPRLRTSFSDISAASRRMTTSQIAPSPFPTPSLDETSLSSGSPPSSPEIPRVPRMLRFATLPMVNKSKLYSDANLLVQYEGLVPSFAAAAKISVSGTTGVMAMDESGYVADTSAESIDLSLGHEEQGHRSSQNPSSQNFDVSRFTHARGVDTPSSPPSSSFGAASTGSASATSFHPYRRPVSASAVAPSSSRSTTPRLVRSVSQSPPSGSYRRPPLRRTFSSQVESDFFD